MKKHIFRNRKARYASISVILTVLVITVTILTNYVFGMLAKRFEWYTSMLPTPNYDVSEACYALLEDAYTEFASEGRATHTEIIFCDDEDGIAEDQALTYILETAKALQARFPEHITVQCYDTRTNPTYVKQYATTIDKETGEEVDVAIPRTSLIITNGNGYHRIYSRDDFYLIKSADSNFWAYNGDRIMASGILRAIDPEQPIACFTLNHGEGFVTYDLVYLLDEAGYEVQTLDLYKDPIPDNCELIISYNPTSDLIADEISAVSEIEKLEQFLAQPGKSFLAFIGNNTPSLPNYEAYLETWGVDFSYHTAGKNSHRYMVGDAAGSLTTDGYTIYGEAATEGNAAKLIDGLGRPAVFKNATAMQNARTFVSSGDGSYQDGNRTMYALYTGASSAMSWANGLAVSDADDAILMSVTEQTLTGGSSYVGVIASTEFANEDLLQSVVYGNPHLLFRTLHIFGKTFTPEGVTAKPIQSSGISLITTRQMLTWTIVLAAIPAVAAVTSGVLILVKRRRV